MESKQPSMLDLLLEAHIGLDRQGPGSSKTMSQALDYLKPLERFERVLEIKEAC